MPTEEETEKEEIKKKELREKRKTRKKERQLTVGKEKKQKARGKVKSRFYD